MAMPKAASGPAPIILLAALGAALALVGVANSGANTEALITPTEREATASKASLAREVLYYDDLAQMQASSDLVVSGRVTAVEPGRAIGGDPDEPYSGAIQMNDVQLEVADWLGGTQPPVDASETMTLEEESLGALASPSIVGDAGVWFLVEKDDQPGHYRLSGSGARFLVFAGGDLISSSSDYPWKTPPPKTLDTLEAEIRANQPGVESGSIELAQPTL